MYCAHTEHRPINVKLYATNNKWRPSPSSRARPSIRVRCASYSPGMSGISLPAITTLSLIKACLEFRTSLGLGTPPLHWSFSRSQFRAECTHWSPMRSCLGLPTGMVLRFKSSTLQDFWCCPWCRHILAFDPRSASSFGFSFEAFSQIQYISAFANLFLSCILRRIALSLRRNRRSGRGPQVGDTIRIVYDAGCVDKVLTWPREKNSWASCPGGDFRLNSSNGLLWVSYSEDVLTGPQKIQSRAF